MKRSVIAIGNKVSGTSPRTVAGHLTSQLKKQLNFSRRFGETRLAFSPLRVSLI